MGKAMPRQFSVLGSVLGATTRMGRGGESCLFLLDGPGTQSPSCPCPGKAAWAAAVYFLTYPQLFLTLGQAASPTFEFPVSPPPPKKRIQRPRSSQGRALCLPPILTGPREALSHPEARGQTGGWGWEALESPWGTACSCQRASHGSFQSCEAIKAGKHLTPWTWAGPTSLTPLDLTPSPTQLL